MCTVMADADTPSTEKPFPEAEKPHKAKAASLNTALEESFSRVREDILQMKKVLNQHAEQLTEVNAKLEGFVNMYEFFEYMQHIDQQLELFKGTYAKQETFEAHRQELGRKITEMDHLQDMEKRFREELDSLRKQPDSRVQEDLNKMDADILTLKKSLNRQRQLELEFTKHLGGVSQVAESMKRMEGELLRNAETIAALQKRVTAEKAAVEHDMDHLRAGRRRK